jgi:hypothetical protein
MNRRRGLAATGLAVAIAASTVSVAAVASAAPTAPAVPGPRQPVEHLSLSGANFIARSGNPGCFTGAGSLGAGFAVPRGAMVTGATLFVIDTSPTKQIFGDLSYHDLTSGGTFLLKSGGSGLAGTTTKTVELAPAEGHVLTTGQAVNLSITIGDGTCLKGAEVHFVRDPDVSDQAGPVGTRVQPTTVAGLVANGAPALTGS